MYQVQIHKFRIFKDKLLIFNFFKDYPQSIDIDPQSIVSSIITDSGISDVSETQLSSQPFERSSVVGSISNTATTAQTQQIQQQPQQNISEMGHSRNSSNTSQVSSC